MILDRIELQNFGPFNERSVVELTVSDSSPVVMIYGENERGKTSFANAIRWCLYGRARGRGGRDIATVSLMNWEALELGTYSMSVKLTFEHAGRHHLLTRHVQAPRRPVRDADLERIVTLEIDGIVQPTERIVEIVSSILHEDISRFFFFDGEMLNEYEDLLNDPERAPALVRKSIEQILGLPALERAAKDLEELRTSAEKRQLQETRKNRENEKLIHDAQQKQEELAAIESDISQNSTFRQRLEETRAGLRDERDRFAEIQVEVRLLDERESELKQMEVAAELARQECCSLLQRVWWMPLEERLHREFDAAITADNKERELDGELAASNVRINGIESTIHLASCDLCSQSVGSEVSKRLRSELDGLRDKIKLLEREDSDIRASRDRMLQLRPLVAVSALRNLHSAETEFRRCQLRSAGLVRKIFEIKQRVRNHERAEVQRVEREYDDCIAQLNDVNRNIQRSEGQRTVVQGTLERLRVRIRSLPEADKKLATESSVYSALENLFERGIQAFREQVRKDVEVEATRIHHLLSNESDYDHLQITPQYGLVLVNREGRTIHHRSAGSEQILALSLIGALNRCATREAPVVMDTPFGRLDVGHRANILKFAPQFGRQVVLLVQSGEFDRSRDMGYLAGKVSNEFRIVRDGASDRSVIVNVRSQETA
jgi:DNA sulfur modification protein DndD